MKTATEENNVFKMLNAAPPQRHKLGTIILNGDDHKRKENHSNNIVWGSHRGNTEADKNTKIIITRVPGHPPNGAR